MKTFLTAHFLRSALVAALCISGSAQAASLSQFSNMFKSVKASSVVSSVKNQSFTSAHPILMRSAVGLATTVAVLAGIEGWRAYKSGDGFVNLVHKDFVKARKFLYAKKEDLVEIRQKIEKLDKQIADYEAMTGYVVESVRPALAKLRDERQELVKEKTTLVKRLGLEAEEKQGEGLTRLQNDIKEVGDSIPELRDSLLRQHEQASSLYQSLLQEAATSGSAASTSSSSTSTVSPQPTASVAASATAPLSATVVAPVVEPAQTVVPQTATNTVVTEKENLTQQIEAKKHILSTTFLSREAVDKLTAEIGALVEQRDGKNPQIERYAKQIEAFPQQLSQHTTVAVSTVAPSQVATPETPVSLPVLVPQPAQALAEQRIRLEIEGLEKRMFPLQVEHDQLTGRSEELSKKEKKRLTLLKTQIGQLEKFVADARGKLDEVSTAETVKAEPANA